MTITLMPSDRPIDQIRRAEVAYIAEQRRVARLEAAHGRHLDRIDHGELIAVVAAELGPVAARMVEADRRSAFCRPLLLELVADGTLGGPDGD
jgi:hypothetical protein